MVIKGSELSFDALPRLNPNGADGIAMLRRLQRQQNRQLIELKNNKTFDDIGDPFSGIGNYESDTSGRSSSSWNQHMSFANYKTRAMSGVKFQSGELNVFARESELFVNFERLPIGGLFGKLKLLTTLEGLDSGNLPTALNLLFAGRIETDSGIPESDCRKRQNGRESSDDALVVVADKITCADYQRNKRALQSGTVFIAILTVAGAIWRMAGFKR
jgi:hypothetical protein